MARLIVREGRSAVGRFVGYAPWMLSRRQRPTVTARVRDGTYRPGRSLLDPANITEPAFGVYAHGCLPGVEMRYAHRSESGIRVWAWDAYGPAVYVDPDGMVMAYGQRDLRLEIEQAWGDHVGAGCPAPTEFAFSVWPDRQFRWLRASEREVG